MEHHALVAAQSVAAAAGFRLALHIVQVEAGLPLGIGEDQFQFAGRQLGQKFGLLRRAARSHEEAAADHDGGHVGFHHQAAAEFLHQHHGVDGAAADAAVFFR